MPYSVRQYLTANRYSKDSMEPTITLSAIKTEKSANPNIFFKRQREPYSIDVWHAMRIKPGCKFPCLIFHLSHYNFYTQIQIKTIFAPRFKYASSYTHSIIAMFYFGWASHRSRRLPPAHDYHYHHYNHNQQNRDVIHNHDTPATSTRL